MILDAIAMNVMGIDVNAHIRGKVKRDGPATPEAGRLSSPTCTRSPSVEWRYVRVR